MRSRSSRLSFAARYLAAVRAGGAPLDVWRERRREEASLPPPNRCDDCSVREGCHQTFGEVEGIGLFPFTADSLDRSFAALHDRDSGMQIGRAPVRTPVTTAQLVCRFRLA